MSEPTNVFELRRYRLQPGKREDLIALFEREFVENQEAAGMTLHGFYRDTSDLDAFVWMRSFPDMDRRSQALATFYGGDVWKQWSSAANGTMLNSDNVLLLEPTGTVRAFDQTCGVDGVITITTCSLAPGRAADFAAAWETFARPVLESCGARIDATFITKNVENSFPRLPVREGETVFVWVSAFRDESQYKAFNDSLSGNREWREAVFPRLDAQLWRPAETAVLTPTSRSRHGW